MVVDETRYVRHWRWYYGWWEHGTTRWSSICRHINFLFCIPSGLPVELWKNEAGWYMCIRQWAWSSLVWVMNWCLLWAKPLPEPELTYYQEHFSVEFKCIFCRRHCINSFRRRQMTASFQTFQTYFLEWKYSCCDSLKCVSKGPIDNNPALIQIMDWCWSGDKPFPESMMASVS